jgi:sporulation protein YlmC with PRC-barrel domain
MLYLSQVLGRPILDLEGERVATLKDVIVRLGEDEHPPVSGFVARYRRRDFFLPRWRISHFGEEGVRLNSDILDLRPFMRREGEVLLARDVLDKQLIDVDGKRVVRVNDVQIIEAANEWRVTGADVSLSGLWRRLAPAFLRSDRPVEVIDWADVGYLATDAATVQLKSSRGKLAPRTSWNICRRTKQRTCWAISPRTRQRTCSTGWTTTNNSKSLSSCLTKMTVRAD